MNHSGRWDLPTWDPPLGDLPGDVAPATFVRQAEDPAVYRWRMAFAISAGANGGFLVLLVMALWMAAWH